DAYESDAGLQQRCAAVYEQLAARQWVAPWHVVDGDGAEDLAAAVLAHGIA
ncbi:MAG: dTMP kinase, partial [Actinomycetota bacterium]|nr:dTMP kinase [Actinomycetota bacterium]